MPDLKWDFENNDFGFTDTDVSIEVDSIVQEFYLRYSTPKGSHFYYYDYGNKYFPLGVPNTKENHFAIYDAMEDLCQQDERIIVASLDLEGDVDTVAVEIVLNGSKLNLGA